MLQGQCVLVDCILKRLYGCRGKENWSLMQRFPTGAAAEVEEQVNGTCVGVTHARDVHGQTARDIIGQVPFQGVDGVPVLCLGLSDYRYKLAVCLVKNCAVGQKRLALLAPTL
jgi:hypothetical protein